MAVVIGDYLRFVVDDVEYDLQMEGSLSITSDMIETTHKQTGGWKTFVPGDKGGTISCTARYDASEGEQVTQTFSDISSGTKLTSARFGDTQSTGYFWSAEGYVSSLTVEGPRNDVGSVSLEVQLTGQITQGQET